MGGLTQSFALQPTVGKRAKDSGGGCDYQVSGSDRMLPSVMGLSASVKALALY